MTALLAAIVGVVITVVVIKVRATKPTVAPAHTHLVPTPAQVAYRFAIKNMLDPRIELDKTIVAFEERVKGSSQSLDMSELADLYYTRGQLGGDKRDYDASDAMARRSLEILPSPNGATLTLAKVANARHDFREAIRLAETIKKRTVGVPTVIATAYLALGELPAAVRAANQAITIKPDGGTYLTRALVFQAQGRDEEAASDFIAAAHAEDFGDVQGAAKTRALWGRFLIRRGELAGAATVLDEALRIAPDFPLAQAYGAELLLRSGKPKEAATLFEQAFAESRQVRYLIDQARALDLAGEKANADAFRAQVETIVRGELGEGGLGHRLDLVEVLIDRGNTTRLTEALALANEEVGRRPSAETLYQLARAKAWAGSFSEAFVDIQAALATGAREAQIYELASRIEAKRGDASAAAVYARLAAELDPANTGWRGSGLP